MAAVASPVLSVVRLDETHDRAAFACGIDSLDRYLRTQAGQDIKRRTNGVFVMVDSAQPSEVQGYYTLAATSLAPGDVPDAARTHIPRYPLISATLIGRFAVAAERQGQRLGALLLADALKRAYASSATIGSTMIVVDALNERAAAFYKAHDFIPLIDSLRLVFPMRLVPRYSE